MLSMRALRVRSIPAFKELSALARITCAPTELGRENELTLTHTRAHLCLVVVVHLRVRLGRTFHVLEVDAAGYRDELV